MKRIPSGFTLVELTIALSIVVIAMGLVIVRVGGWSSRQRLHASARALGNTIRAYREKARLDEEVYTLRLEPRQYWIEARGDAGETIILRRGTLGQGQTFHDPFPAVICLKPKGILPETILQIRSAAGDEVSLFLGSVTHEIEYRTVP